MLDERLDRFGDPRTHEGTEDQVLAAMTDPALDVVLAR
jgi:hypothetical protein